MQAEEIAREKRIAAGLQRMVEEEAPKVAAKLTPARAKALLAAVEEGTIFAYDGRREVRKDLMDMWLVSSLPGPSWGKPTPLGYAVATALLRERTAPEGGE